MGFVMDQLDALPVWGAALVLIGGLVAFALAGPLLVRRLYGADRLAVNNEVAGYKFAGLGAVYAVLLAFAVFVVWDSFREAETTVLHEAGSVAVLYRLSAGLEEAPGAAVRAATEAYLRAAIEQEWPALDAGRPGDEAASRALTALYAAVLGWHPADGREEAILGAMLDQLDTATEARRERLSMAGGAVPDLVWLALLAGAALTIGFTFFFATESLGAQMLMSALLALSLALSLLVILLLDRPFAGTVRVSAAPFERVLEEAQAGLLTTTAARPARR